MARGGRNLAGEVKNMNGTERTPRSRSGAVSGFEPDYATPPGWTLEEWLNDNNLKPGEFAQTHRMGADRVRALIAGEAALNEGDARRLEAATGIPAKLWNGMERTYREAVERLGGK